MNEEPKESDRGNSGMGNHLHDLGKWASFPVQIVGYLPLAVERNDGDDDGRKVKSFKFTWNSIWPFISIFLSLSSFSWCLGYFWRYKEFKDFIEFKSPTETGAFNLMILTTNISGIYTRLFGLIHGKRYAKFWKQTRSLLDRFQNTKDESKSKLPEKFREIRSSCRNEFILMITPVIVHVLYFYVWALVGSFTDDDGDGNELDSFSNADTQVYLGLAFGSLIAYLHVSNGIWMNFFVKIYSQCLLSISEELTNLGKALEAPMVANSNLIAGIPKPDYYPTTGYRQSGLPSTQLREVLDKLACVDDELARFNDFFGTLLFFQITNCVINLLVFSFFACLWMGRGRWQDGFLETVVPLYLYGKELLDMGTVAENLSAAADKVLIALAEDLMLGNLGEEIYLRIQIISVQLCTKPPVISARQFFTINRGLVTSVMSALATFLVVLVQFRDQDDEDEKQNLITTTAKAAAATNHSVNSTG